LVLIHFRTAVTRDNAVSHLFNAYIGILMPISV